MNSLCSYSNKDDSELSLKQALDYCTKIITGSSGDINGLVIPADTIFGEFFKSYKM